MTKNRKKNRGKEETKICSNCFKSNHIIFSFAYLKYSKNLREKEALVFFERLKEISSVDYSELRKWEKFKGFEEIKVKINKEIPPEFETEIEKFNGKYTIFRLYKGNGITPGRIIGKLVNKVFYIFYIDVKGDLYKH